MQEHRWLAVLTEIVNGAHTVAPDELGELVDRALCHVGLAAEIYLVDLAQRTLFPLRSSAGDPLTVDATLAGRAYRLTELAQARGERATLVWAPLVDGTARLGVLRFELPPGVEPDEELRRRCWLVSGLLGHLIMTKLAYGDALHRAQRSRPLSVAAELLRHLLPPLTLCTNRVVLSAVLEPFNQIGGDAFDYAVDHAGLYLAIFDGVGHNLQAGLITSVALAATRNARRSGVTDLAAIARRADEVIADQGPGRRFVTAVLARLDTGSGQLRYLRAGHPPPLLLRATKTVKLLDGGLRTPLGVPPPAAAAALEPAEEQLEPDDRLLLYSDGVEQACDPTGQIFGLDRLVDLTEHSAAAGLPPPETLRRLVQAILHHQRGQLRDDATLVLVEWSARGAVQLMPHLDTPLEVVPGDESWVG
ncbi:MAG TPA: PP2C family protein-serine/threonine phosphatase, partial [Pseudonocardiaceae bacterium]|nr:PP2C family protein-serine/threonine phosphatase [Pseudonocardiaceae bacterium]